MFVFITISLLSENEKDNILIPSVGVEGGVKITGEMDSLFRDSSSCSGEPGITIFTSSWSSSNDVDRMPDILDFYAAKIK